MNKLSFTFILLITTSFFNYSFGCTFPTSKGYNQQSLGTFISSNCPGGTTSLIIPDGVAISITGGGWDLDALGITSLTIQGTGSLIFGNNDDVTFSNLGEIIIMNTSNSSALDLNGSNPTSIYITVGTDTYTGNDFAAIIANGGVDANFVLDVELGHFKLSNEGDFVKLDWRTLSETDNLGFEVQRKLGDENWETIGFVEGQGNSTEIVDYTFLDDDIRASTTYYYRLKIIDFEEQFEYSSVLTVSLNSDRKNTISIYPNPANSILNIQLDNTNNSVVRLFGINGQKIKETTFTQQIVLDISTLEQGVYFMTIENEQEFFRQKVFVLK